MSTSALSSLALLKVRFLILFYCHEQQEECNLYESTFLSSFLKILVVHIYELTIAIHLSVIYGLQLQMISQL